MSEAKHSELPWRVFTTTDGRKLIGVGKETGEGILDAGFGVWAWDDAEGIANAAFIVKACNAHDKLVAALREARGCLADDCLPWLVRKQIDRALASLKED